MRRQEAFTAIALGAVAGLLVVPAVLLAVEVGIDRVRVGETLGGSLFAVLFFCSTSLTTAIYQNSASLMRAVMTSYVIKSSVVAAGLYVVSLQRFDQPVVAVSVTVSAFAFLVVQTVYIAGQKGRMKRRIARLG